jgi:hypothetical protein
MIGVGGVGGTIVADVRRQLERRINAQGASPAARQHAAQYRFFLVDTKEEAFSRDFRPNERFVVPSGLDKFYVDEKITNWHASDGRGDDFFETWWPTQNGVPYRVGDFDEGAGQIRIKGKLAYRIHIAQGKGAVVDAVDEAVRSIRNARGISSNRDLHKIPVYIVSSLGGGTGSGIVLTLAKHLRRTLPTYCVLQGVFLLASIAALAPVKADEASIWANTDAALREIDYFQRSQAFRLDQPNPYLEWPGSGNRIPNREAPFQYIYLFTDHNRETHTLESLDAYTRMVSECLVAETFGPIAELIKGPHSQFVARFVEAPDVEERPTSYASVGLAGVRYPSERIIQHLSRSFGARVIAKAFDYETLESEGIEETEARSFLQQRSDLWDEDPSIRQDYTNPISDDEEMPRPRKMDDSRFIDANKERIPTIVGERLRDFDGWRSRELIPFLLKKTKLCEDQMLRSDSDGLRQFLTSQFDERADGVPRAVNTLAALRKIIKEQLDLAEKAIEDKEQSTGDGDEGVGLKATAKAERQGITDGIRGIQDGFGKVRNKSGKTAKEQFVANWNAYVNTEIDLAIATQTVAYYSAVLREVEATQDYLRELILAARSQGELLDRAARDDLGANVKESVLNVGILDNVKIVDFHFRHLMDQAVQDAGGGLIKDLITGERGLSYALKVKVDRRAGVRHELVLDDFREAILKAVLDAGRRLFEKEVAKLTIWDAIKYECIARKEIPELDFDFNTAKDALDQHRAELNRNGTPLVNGDTYLLEQYIQAKLARLKRQAAPFWQLDQSEMSNYADRPGLLYPITVLGFDRTSYEDFAAREQLDPGLVQAIAQSVGVEPQHLPGPDAIMLYCREGVAPLFFLGRKEKDKLRDSAARISGRNKEIYTDIRLKSVVDPIIAPPERPEDRRKYAVGIAVRHFDADGANMIGWRRADGVPVAFTSVHDAMRALAADPSLERELFAAVNAEMDHLSDRDRSDAMEQATERAKQFLLTRDAAETKWWQQTINTVGRRLNNAQFRV